MQDILHQLGQLMLGSIPTVCLFLILLAAYAVLVRKPLEKVLAERHARTGGAMDEAHRAIEAAEAKTAEYEKRTRDARAAIFEAAGSRHETGIRSARQGAGRGPWCRHRVALRRHGRRWRKPGTRRRAQIEAGSEALSQQIVCGDSAAPARGSAAMRSFAVGRRFAR